VKGDEKGGRKSNGMTGSATQWRIEGNPWRWGAAVVIGQAMGVELLWVPTTFIFLHRGDGVAVALNTSVSGIAEAPAI
jgi:hypothetical protein